MRRERATCKGADLAGLADGIIGGCGQRAGGPQSAHRSADRSAHFDSAVRGPGRAPSAPPSQAFTGTRDSLWSPTTRPPRRESEAEFGTGSRTPVKSRVICSVIGGADGHN